MCNVTGILTALEGASFLCLPPNSVFARWRIFVRSDYPEFFSVLLSNITFTGSVTFAGYVQRSMDPQSLGRCLSLSFCLRLINGPFNGHIIGSITQWLCSSWTIFVRSDHPENYLVLLSKITFSLSKYPKQIISSLENIITADPLDTAGCVAAQAKISRSPSRKLLILYHPKTHV